MPAGRFVGIGLEAGDDQTVEVLGDARIELGGECDFPFVAGLGNGPLHEPAGEHPVHRGAEVVGIGPLVDHLLDGLFRGHELGGSLDPILGLAAQPGGAEVDELHLAILRQHDVVRV